MDEVKIEDNTKIGEATIVECLVPEKEIELFPQKWISPTSINAFFKCPRSYFYQYIAKIRIKPNIDMIKGSIVHRALELFFVKYPETEDLETHLLTSYAKALEENQKQIKMLELKEEELTKEKKDCLNMLVDYLEDLKKKARNYIEAGKAENIGHAFFLLRPKFREVSVTDDELHCKGVIDRVDTDFDGVITLVDYKTSKKWGVGLPMDYKRQLSIYSLLYQRKEKITADFVSVNFLRISENYFLEVTPSFLRYALDTITDTYAKTRSTSMADYPKLEGSLCRRCDFKDICSGKEEWSKRVREEKIIELIKDDKKDE